MKKERKMFFCENKKVEELKVYLLKSQDALLECKWKKSYKYVLPQKPTNIKQHLYLTQTKKEKDWCVQVNREW